MGLQQLQKAGSLVRKKSQQNLQTFCEISWDVAVRLYLIHIYIREINVPKKVIDVEFSGEEDLEAVAKAFELLGYWIGGHTWRIIPGLGYVVNNHG